MQEKDWKVAWEKDDTGWHRDTINPTLTENNHQLGLNSGDTLFFPLCGASLDMKWALDQGYQVKGVDLSELALEKFLHEQNIAYAKQGNHYYGENISLYCCDIFELSEKELGDVKAIFDRGALVALDEEVRARYFQHLKTHCAGAKMLAEVFDYDPSVMKGPPFSVPLVYFQNRLGLSDEIKELTHAAKREEKLNAGGVDLKVYLIQL